uniref:Uncharacterized protein n=1 Tax=Alexandrium monilatum TaxID=311494 RepID=A0A7S4W7Q0_9DINO|mmetsp:Transcript_2654/g.8228  ORF Transcript_2654/g.8228 Transcript_2654/m.8228 type:complete len:113 (-) Transcript_2654:45-383(-)
MSKRPGEERSVRCWVANIVAALLLGEGARVLAKSELCNLSSSTSASLGLAMLPGVMMLNRMPGASVVGLVASIHGLFMSPSKAIEGYKAWPWPLVSAGCCVYLFVTRPGRLF